ncbi:hypothetical protein VTO42DRAFT_1257 [Malbranchea cinnamomea]
MQLRAAIQLGFLALALPSATAAASWGFTDATLSIQSKGSGVGSGIKQTFSEKQPLPDPVTLQRADTLKLLLTTQEGGSAKVPHQAFLLLKDEDSGLDISYPLSVKDSGKAKLELTQKDLPVQFVKDSKTLDANLVIASFGSAKGYIGRAFKLHVDRDLNEPLPSTDVVRYGKRDEIHHIFKPDPKSPPLIVSLFFTAAVLAVLPALIGVWLFLGANLKHLPTALKSSPAAHITFLASIVGLEAVFFMYYTSWNLFQTLPVAAVVGTVAVLSGSRALGEVQERRLAGLR